MNCDQAFDRLTEPAATTDTALARHLEQCPRCRAMQQTLSPAMDWLRTTAAEDDTDTTRDWNRRNAPLLTEESVAVAIQVARQLPRDSSAHSARKALGIALVALFGMALGVLVIGQKADSHPPVAALSPPAETTATVCLWTRPEGASSLPSTTSQSVVDSCIACHVPNMLRN